MSDLVAWLRVQLDEDEQVATAATHGNKGHWRRRPIEGYDFLTCLTCRIDDENDEPVVYDEGSPSSSEADHIVLWDPARVLAEVGAKRQILDMHQPSDRLENGLPFCSRCTDLAPCDTLHLLALPYADRPGYLDEWRLK